MEEEVGERSTEVGAIDARVAGGLWIVDVLTLGAVQLDVLRRRCVGEASGQEMRACTVHTWAFAEFTFLILLQL